ncbi:hypothetical protein HY626_01565 [Candidatus Uhrbacteria bacterium]|nr:hypothetical protein [Candidatus Uhrbacteria bacterium]
MTEDQLRIFLQNEPLFHSEPSLAMIDPAFLTKPFGSVYYGTGLTTPRSPSIGLPFDILIFILGAERLRRLMGLDRIYHHIADTHALTNPFCTPEVVAAMAAEYRDVIGKIARAADIPVDVRLSSDFDRSDEYEALLARVHTDKAEYVRRELADMLWYRETHSVRLKLGWLLQAGESELGFDERLYDREFRVRCDEHMSFAYVVAGRTLDPKRMRASPYIAVADERRILFKPGEDVRAKIEQALPSWGADKTMGGLVRHLGGILRLWDRLTGSQPQHGTDVFVRVQALIDQILA